MAVLSFLGYIFQTPVMSEPILYVIMYVWSRREPEALLNIFGFKFQSLYLPWVYIAIRLLMGGAISLPLIGIAVGHLYFFLIEVLPGNNNIDMIRTPQFVVDLIQFLTGLSQPRVASVAQAATNAAGGHNTAAARNLPRATGGYNWGAGGRVLGRS